MLRPPLPSVIQAYEKVTGLDPRAHGKRVGKDLIVECVRKANHKNGDARPSLRINMARDVWKCDPCGAFGGISGGKSTHLVVHAGIAATTSDASKWLVPPEESKPYLAPPPFKDYRLIKTYEYCAAEGNVLYEVLRYERDLDSGGVGKTFLQQRVLPKGGYENRLGDVERVPYRFPQLILAIGDGRTIYVVEGEKDADALTNLGLVATTNSGGAGWRWTSEYVEKFRGAFRVVIIADSDSTGRASAQERATSLLDVVSDVRLIDLMPERCDGYDVSDWIGEGHGRDNLERLAQDTPIIKRVASLPSGNAGKSLLLHTTPTLVTRALSDVEPRSIEWLWEGRIPLGQMTLIAGVPGSGKTFVAGQIAAEVSRGGSLPFGPTLSPADVIILPFEDDASVVLRPRYQRAGAALNRIHVVDGVLKGDTMIDFGVEHVELLRVLLDSIPGTRLVIVDPVMSLLGGRTDANRSAEVRSVLAPLVRLARERNFALVVIAHVNKGNVPAISRVEGSLGGFVGLARSVLAVGKDEDERRGVAVLKSNYAATSGSAIAFDLDDGEIHWGNGDKELTADDLFAHRVHCNTTSDVAEQQILEVLAATSWTAGGLLQSIVVGKGVSQKTFERARAALRARGAISRRGEPRIGFEWTLSLKDDYSTNKNQTKK